MKGFRSSIELWGYTIDNAKKHYTSKGKEVATFVMVVGGNKSKGMKGVLFRCHAYGVCIERVCKAVSEAGLYVHVVSDKPLIRVVRKGSKIYVNNDVNIRKLRVQMRKEDEVLTEVEMRKYVERNDEVRMARAEGRTLESIGKEFGISKERVRQILAMEEKDGK